MTTQVIPTFSNGLVRYRQVTPLDGLDFVLLLSFNERDGNWYLSIQDSQGEPIQGATGQKLVKEWDPLRLCVDPRRPPGTFLVASDLPDDPGLFELGNGASLFYIPEADLA